jgi:hypothetical protein
MPGFDFSNYNRNAALHARGVPLPKATSTGTTIVGCIYDNGVVVSQEASEFNCGEHRLTFITDRCRHKSHQWSYRSRQGTPTPERSLRRPLTVRRTAKSCTTSHQTSGVPALELQLTLNSPRPSSLPTSNYTPSQPAEHRESSPL